MGTKQLPGLFAPDGSYYVTNTDGSGNLLNTRTVLTQTTTFYVSTTGSDTTGTGTLTNPFQTWQGAYDTIRVLYDFGGQMVNIQATPGNQTFAAGINLIYPWSGGGSLNLLGDPVLDGAGHWNTKFSITSGTIFNFPTPLSGGIQLGEFLLQASAVASVDPIVVNAPNTVYIDILEFGNLNSGIGVSAAVPGASVIMNAGGTVWIEGSSSINFIATNGGLIELTSTFIVLSSSTNIATPLPSGSIFYEASYGGIIQAAGITYTGNFSNSTSVYKYQITTGGQVNIGNTLASIPGTLTSTDNAVRHPGYVTGRYYYGINPTVIGSSGLANGVMIFAPFVVEYPTTWTKVGTRVTAFAAGSHIAFGLYASGNGIPTTNLFSTSAQSSGANGIVEVTGLSWTVNPGFYFLAVNSDGAPVISFVTGDSATRWLGNTADNAFDMEIFNGATTFGTWPNNPSVLYAGSNAYPQIWLRV